TIGWISHWNEMISGPYKIGRPRQLYIGQPERDYPTDK
ncbi:MAG: citrate synthase, partial [Marinomonas primoryensis]